MDDALTDLAKIDERQSRLVELRFFAGLSLEEMVQALEVGTAPVQRDWKMERAWLFRTIFGESRTLSSARLEWTKQFLEEALRMASEKSAANLDSDCGDDAALRKEVESLIASFEAGGSQFLGVTAPEVLDLTSIPSSLL